MKYLLVKEHQDPLDVILDVIPMDNVIAIYVGHKDISIRYKSIEGEQCLMYAKKKVYFIFNVEVL